MYKYVKADKITADINDIKVFKNNFLEEVRNHEKRACSCNDCCNDRLYKYQELKRVQESMLMILLLLLK